MTEVELGETLALTNAILNSTSAACLVGGRIAIARKKIQTHRAFMVSAFGASTLFLISYLIRVWLTGTHRDPHTGWLHAVYLAVLVTHMLLAMVIVPMVLTTLYFALRARFESHRKIARWTFPVWLYVSVTGVIVYVILYRIPA